MLPRHENSNINVMQFLCHIYFILHWFGHKIHHQLKDYIFYKNKSLSLMFFLNRNSYEASFSKNFLNQKISLKTFPNIFCGCFVLSLESQTDNTRQANQGCKIVHFHGTKTCGRYWTPNSSHKGPMKQGLSVHLSRGFLGIAYLVFSKFWHVVRYKKLCMAELDFLKKKNCPKNGESVQKIGFFNVLKNLLISFS